MTIGDRIQLYAGTVASTTELQEFIDEAVRIVIWDLPEEVLLPMSSELTDSGSGVSVTDMRVLSAHKAGYEAPRMEEDLRARLVEENNTYEAREFRPAHYILGTTAYVVPDGGTVVVVQTPTVAYTDTTVSGVPLIVLDMIVFKAAELALQNKLVDEQEGFSTTITLPTAPTAPTAPAITYSDASATAPSAVSIAALPDSPVFVRPPSLADKPTLPTIGSAFSSTATAPTAPSAPSFTYVGATEATVAATTVSALGSAPTFSPVVGVADFSEWDTYYDLEDPEMMDQARSKIQVKLEEQRTQLQNNTAEFQESLASYQEDARHKIEQARITLQEAIADARASTDVAVTNARATFEAEAAQYQNELNLFGLKLELYGKEVEVEVQERYATLDRHIQLFSAEVSADTARHRSQLEEATAAFQQSLSVYQAAIQRNNLAAEIARQEASQTAQNATDVEVQNKARQLEASVSQYQASLSHFQEEMRLYTQKSEVLISEKRALASVVSEKLRMIHFDLERAVKKYQEARMGVLRYLWPHRTWTVQLPPI